MLLSHGDVVVHGHKGLFMMHECKRILNKQTAGEGLWFADLAKAQDRQDGEVAEVREANDGTEDRADATGAAEHCDAKDGDADAVTHVAQDVEVAAALGEATQHAADVLVAKNMDGVGATEHADSGAVIADPTEQVRTDAPKNESQAQIFQVTISLRDDWLHRGEALQDMDLQTYAEHIERRRKPIRGDGCATVRPNMRCSFDKH